MEITRNVTEETGWDWHKIAADLRAGTSPLKSGDELDVGDGRKVVFGRDERGKAFFTFKDALFKSRFGDTSIWRDSDIRKELNGPFLETLPSDLIEEIAAQNILQVVENEKHWTEDRVFLLSVRQVWGWNYEDEDPKESQIDIFKSRRNRVKNLVDGEHVEPAYWWLRSAFSSSYVYSVSSNGYDFNDYASSTGAVCPSFCL